MFLTKVNLLLQTIKTGRLGMLEKPMVQTTFRRSKLTTHCRCLMLVIMLFISIVIRSAKCGQDARLLHLYLRYLNPVRFFGLRT
jgi:hypothetical protein